MTHELLDKVLKSPQLPSLPTIALKVIDLAQDPDADFDELATVLQHDPALSAKMLATVNSALYGRRREVGTISAALKVLGLNSVKTLALGFSLVGKLKDSCHEEFDHVGYWRRSLYTATAARGLSRSIGNIQHEEAFLGGLLQDLGMVALSQVLGSQYARVMQAAGPRHSRLGECEKAMLGFDHSQIGAELAESWGLPPILVGPIRLHEKPDLAGNDLRDIVRTVALGNRVAEIFVSEDGDGDALDRYYTQAEEWFGLARTDAEAQLSGIHAATQEMSRLFDLPTGDLGDPDEILLRANEALTQITQQSQLQSPEGPCEASLDTVTGLSDRDAFDRFISDRFRAATTEKPTSVVLLDIDRFTQFNETYFREMGDRILTVVAQIVERVAESRGFVFRSGGDEFAVVCPATSAEVAAALARQIQAAVDATAVVLTVHGEELRITCSIGLATHDGSTYENEGQLLEAADQVLQAGKAEGPNRIGVAAGTTVSDAA